jgi:hypothetical protein
LLIPHFAIQYSDIIKGIVLIDASPTDYSSNEQLKSQLPVINERYNGSKVIERINNHIDNISPFQIYYETTEVS